jgi:HAD superfamily hydrolase (TIGR01509 family)
MSDLIESIFSKEAAIFDMDGVLIDSQPLHYQTDISVLKRAGYPASLETVIPYTGVSNPDRWPRYKETLSLKPAVEQLIEWQTEILIETFKNEDTPAIEGIPELLAKLRDERIKTAVATSSQHALIDLTLRKAGIIGFFDALVSGEDVKIGKPAPDVFLFAAEKLGAPPERCVVFEDSPNGIASAKNAGMLCVAYNNPNTYGRDFTLADHVIEKFNECY